MPEVAIAVDHKDSHWGDSEQVDFGHGCNYFAAGFGHTLFTGGG